MARKALCVLMSVVLVVGLMPGLTAWGESNQVTTAAADETLDVNDDNAGSENSENSQTQDNPIVVNEEDDPDENDDELSDDPDITSDEDDALLGVEEAKDESAKALLLATASLPSAEDLVPAELESADALGNESESAADEVSLMAASDSYYINFNYNGGSTATVEGNAAGAKDGETVAVSFVNAKNTSGWFSNTYSIREHDGPNGGASNGYETWRSKGATSPMSVTYTVPKGYTIRSFAKGSSNVILRINLSTYSEKYAVMLDVNGGTKRAAMWTSRNVTAGNSVTLPTASQSPSRSYYTFSGWNTARDGSGDHYDSAAKFTPTSDTTLYAEWTRTVNLNASGGDASFTPASPLTFYYDSTGTGSPSSSTVVLTGNGEWTAVGWTTGTATTAVAVNADPTFTLQANALTKTSATYYALLQRELTLTYDANGADAGTNTVPESQSVTQLINTRNYTGSYTKRTVSLAEPGDSLKKRYYNFVGWTINGVLYDMVNDTKFTWKNANASAQVTAYATWERIPPVENNVTVEMAGWTYGDTPNSPEYTADDGIESISVEYSTSKTGTYSPTKPTNAGTYWVRATVPAHDNYLEGTASASFTIAPKPVAIEWSNDEFTYDGTSHKPMATVNADDLVGNDACTVTVSGEQTDAGSYTAWASGLSNPNYALPASGASHAFTISKAALTVKAKDHAIDYGDFPEAGGVTYAVGGGAASDSKPTGLTGSLSYTYGYAQYGNAGTYKDAITPGGLGSPNYDITYEKGTLTVNPRTVTLLWSEPNLFPYNEQEQTWPKPVVGNTVRGDTLDVVWASDAAFTAKEKGDYAVEAKGLTGGNASNYKLPDSATGTWSITESGEQPITVSIAGWTYGKYDKDKNGPTVSAAYGAGTATFAYYTDASCDSQYQVAEADMETIDLGDGNTCKVPKNADEYWVKATIPATGTYPGGSATCGFKISKRSVTIKVDTVFAYEVINADRLTYSIIGDVASDADREAIRSSVTLSYEAFDPLWGRVSRPITASIDSSRAPLKNYNINTMPGTYIYVSTGLDLKKVGSGDMQAFFVYDGKPHKTAATIRGWEDGTARANTVYYGTTAFGSTRVGLETAIYDTLTTDVWYGGNKPSKEDIINNFDKAYTTVSGLTDVSTNPPEHVNAGDYKDYFVALGRSDSSFTFIAGEGQTLITQAPLVVGVGDKTIRYGDNPADKPFDDPENEVTYSGFVNGETAQGLRNASQLRGSATKSGYTYNGYTTKSAPGRYPITFTGSDLSATNYSITYKPGTLIVEPRTLEIDWDSIDSFAFDGKKHAYQPTLKNVPEGFDVKLKLAGTTEATDAGSYTVRIVGLEGDDAAGFEFDDSSALSHKWSITPASLTIKANDNEITYGEAPAGNGVICTDANNDAVDVSSLPGTLQYAFTDGEGSEGAAYEQYGDVGEYTITPSLPASSNYTITYQTGTLTVAPRTVSLTWPSPTALRWTGRKLTYGTPILANVVNGDDVYIDKYTGNTGTDGGSYTATVVSLAGGKAANYALPSNATGAWSIYGAVNNVKVAIDDWTYGDTPSTPRVVKADYGGSSATFGYSTSPYGPFTSALPTNATTGRVDAGTYWLQTKIPSSAVYDPAEVITKFEVLPREVTLTWSPTSFTYDGQKHAPTAAVSGTLGDESCSVLAVSGETDAVGAHTATAIGLDNSNYKLPINDSVQFTIAQAMLTVKANDNGITYGDAPSGSGVKYFDSEGREVSESEAGLGGTLTYSFNYRQFDNVGAYKITPGGLSSPNYAITYVPGALTVKPRVVTLTWDAPSTFTYDGTEHTWNPPTVGNTVNGDKLTATWASGAKVAATDQGTYEPEVGGLVAGASTDADNYKLPDPAKGTWKIVAPSANAMTVSIAGWTYGKTPNSPVVTATFMPENANGISYAYYKDNGGKPGEAVQAADMKDGKPKNAGDYWVKASIPAGQNGNYPEASATCAFTISKADITVTADDKQSVRQDPGTIASLTCSISGDVASWDSLASYFQATSDDSPNQIKPNAAGSYTIKATWATGKSAADLPNYNVKFEPGTYTVTRLLAKVVASGSSWVYDGTDTDGAGKRKAITVKVNDSINGTALDGTAGAAAVTTYYSENEFGSGISDLAKRLQAATEVDADFKTSFASLKSALSGYAQTSPTYKDAGTHRVHFIIVSDQATPDVIVGYKDVVITPAPLVVTANDKGIAYGDPAANDGVKYAGLVAADLDGTEPKSGVLDVAGLAYGYGTYVAGSAPGKYPITPSGLEAKNYSITYAPGTLTVGAKELELKWPDENEFPYNGREQAYRPELIDPSTGNAVTGADVSVQMTAGTYAKTDAGSYTATVTGLTGDGKGNYVLKSSTEYAHAWSITPVALTVRANDNSITYGDAPAADGVTYAGLLTPEAQAGFTGSLSYSYGYAQFGPVGKYAITPSGIASPNYTIDFEDGELTVLKKALSLKWSDDNKLEYTGEPWTYEKPLLDGVVDGDIVRVGLYQGAKGTNVDLYTATVESLTGRDKDNYALLLPASHEWWIVGVENGLDLTMGDWTYGDEPRAPELTADHDGGKATFAYYLDEACEKPVPAADLDSKGVPAVAGSYWVKATVPKSDAGNYREAEAKASFTVERRPITVKAADQIVKAGDAVADDAGRVTADDLAEGDAISSVSLSAPSTALPSFGGSVTPSAATIANADGRDVTSSYDITYEPGEMLVVGDYSTENGKVIYVVLADIWVTVAEAAELLADPGLDGILMERTGAAAYETGTGEPLEVHVLDRGGLAAAVGVYTVTFQTNPEVSARVHVMSSSSTDDETGVTVYANDTEPSADLLRRAKAGDADAIAELVALAGAVAVDEEGNTIPVTGVDLSNVDPGKPGTYRAAYSTDDGDSAAANVVLTEGADDPDPKDGLREKIEEAEGIVGPLDPANPTDEEKKLLEEIDAAKLILDDPDATPDQIRDAIKRLDDAIAALKAARDKKDGPAAASATKPDSARKAATAKTGDALPVAPLAATALAAACALAFAYRRRES